MFGDIGFFELAIISALALIILGPERLPGAARTVGHFVGKARRMIASAKTDLKRELEQHDAYHEVNKVRHEVNNASRDLKQGLKKQDIAGLKEVKRDLEDSLNVNSAHDESHSDYHQNVHDEVDHNHLDHNQVQAHYAADKSSMRYNQHSDIGDNDNNIDDGNNQQNQQNASDSNIKRNEHSERDA